MKKIITSLGIIGIMAVVAISATVAYFNDTETSSGNIFTAGSIDLKVDHKYASYNGQECVTDCNEIGTNLIQNGDFETPSLNYGQWSIYPNSSAGLTKWNVESGAGLEIQNHADGAPHGGNQLAELDSNNSSVISQIITTVAGGKYRLSFWYSPRPNRPAGDNTIGTTVKVVSDGTILVEDNTIGAGVAGGSSTNWKYFSYSFIAANSSTKVMFSDLGISNSFGGYLDDIAVRELSCPTGQYRDGGSCTLWGERDLGETDKFFSFSDIKPGDFGKNIISLHVNSNDAYACLITNHIVDLDNTLTEPEKALGDTLVIGELSPFIKVFAWEDVNANNFYEVGEPIISNADTELATALGKISLTPSSTKYVGVAWCAGTQTVVDNVISCDGSSMGNIAQTDSFTADITAYAVQQRNNPNFTCESVQLP